MAGPPEARVGRDCAVRPRMGSGGRGEMVWEDGAEGSGKTGVNVGSWESWMLRRAKTGFEKSEIRVLIFFMPIWEVIAVSNNAWRLNSLYATAT